MIDKPIALIIEDDPAQVDIFSKAIESAGYETTIFTNGVSALDYLAKKKPYLVVLDLQLPGIAGDEILAYIRGEDRLKDVLVILATANPRMAEPFWDSSDFVMIKPISFTQLKEIGIRLIANA